MVVCVATDHFPPALGGIATFYGNLTELFIRKGHSVIVLTVDFYATAKDEDLITTEGMLTRVVLKKSYFKNYAFYRPCFRPDGLNAPYWLAMGQSMREWLLLNHKKFGIDVIDTIDHGGIGVFLVDPELPPVVITGHGCLTQYSGVNQPKKDDHFKVILHLEKLSFSAADRVLSYSFLNQKDLEKSFQRSIEFCTAPWILDSLYNHPTSTRGNPVVVAGLQTIKGVELLIHALQIVVQQIPDFQCEWTGMDFNTAPGGGAMAAYLQKKYPGIWGHHLLWQDGLDRESTINKIANARFKIIPSIFETFSYVSLEAGTLGKAIIISEAAGASYLFTHKEDAWIVKTAARELAEAIIYLNRNPQFCEELGMKVKNTVALNFNENKIYEERLHHYDETIKVRKEKGVLSVPNLNFIKKYTTAVRKNYYKTRAFIKKLVKHTN